MKGKRRDRRKEGLCPALGRLPEGQGATLTLKELKDMTNVCTKPRAVRGYG